MSEVIKIDTAAMNACISNYMAQKAQLLGALAICTSASALLAQSWAGPSFQITCAKMEKTFNNLKETDEKINDAINELRKTISTMEAAEGKIKASMASLDTGTSPFA